MGITTKPLIKLFTKMSECPVKLFIGGLSWSTDEQSLQSAFSSYGEVASVRVVTDRETGRSKGFGFVEYNSRDEAQAAVDGMNGQDLDGRQIRCDFAQENSGERRERRDNSRGGPYDRNRNSGSRGGRGGRGRGGRGGPRGGRRDYNDRD